MTSPQSFEPTAFRAFELAGWESAAPFYADAIGGIARQMIGPLLTDTSVGPHMCVLDVGTGPGDVAAAVAAAGAMAVGVDFSAAMVTVARGRSASAMLVIGDAVALPFANAAFDAVVMNLCLMHLAEPDQALAEAFRVLRPGGRCGFTVWAAPDVAVGLGLVLNALQQHSVMDTPLPDGPSFFHFSEPAVCEAALHKAGFQQIAVRRLSLTGRFDSPDAMLEAYRGGTVRFGVILRAQTPAALDAIREALRRSVAPYQTDTGVVVPMAALLATAVKP
jgi:ubiquinone/menaquinone biosynthesis C-methylase UbiE